MSVIDVDHDDGDANTTGYIVVVVVVVVAEGVDESVSVGEQLELVEHFVVVVDVAELLFVGLAELYFV